MSGTDFFASLASGSKANCYVIKTADTVLLIDAGLSFRKTSTRLMSLGLTPDMIDAVVITHEHCDHTAGLPMLAKNINAPVYMTEACYLSYIRGKGFDLRNRITQIGTQKEIRVKSSVIETFSVPHDSADCIALKISSGSQCYGICTDTPVPPPPDFFHGCSAVAVESNYDPEMLKCGSYPENLKYRIMSRCGHMSNEGAAIYAAELGNRGCLRIMLCHLSLENNTPEIARRTVGSRYRGELLCAAPDSVTLCAGNLSDTHFSKSQEKETQTKEITPTKLTAEARERLLPC